MEVNRTIAPCRKQRRSITSNRTEEKVSSRLVKMAQTGFRTDVNERLLRRPSICGRASALRARPQQKGGARAPEVAPRPHVHARVRGKLQPLHREATLTSPPAELAFHSGSTACACGACVRCVRACVCTVAWWTAVNTQLRRRGLTSRLRKHP